MRRAVVTLAIVAVALPAFARATPSSGPVPSGFRPASVTFVSAARGWVLGTAPCAHRPCTSIVRTLDGGHTWQGIPAPRTPLLTNPGATGGGVLSLRFADARDGWAYGTQLWSTHNGGSSWHRVTLPVSRPSVLALEAAGGRVWALIGHRTSSGPVTAIRLYWAAVGSDRWHAGPLVPGAYELVLHGSHTWIVAATGAAQTPHLWTLHGLTLSRLSIPCTAAEAGGGGQLAAASATGLLFVCAGQPGLGSSPKRAYVSSDGGHRWTRRGAPSRGGDLYSNAYPSPGSAFVAAASGASFLYGSFDGARQWRSVLTLFDGGLGWSDFGFTTATQGVAVEGRPPQPSRLWMTRDGGHTWSAVAF